MNGFFLIPAFYCFLLSVSVFSFKFAVNAVSGCNKKLKELLQ